MWQSKPSHENILHKIIQTYIFIFIFLKSIREDFCRTALRNVKAIFPARTFPYNIYSTNIVNKSICFVVKILRPHPDFRFQAIDACNFPWSCTISHWPRRLFKRLFATLWAVDTAGGFTTLVDFILIPLARNRFLVVSRAKKSPGKSWAVVSYPVSSPLLVNTCPS